MTNLIGQTLLDRYQVHAFVASGGMGAVYRVLDLERNVPLAMKVLHADLAEDSSVFKRFEREARALKKLAHPNIVPFYGLFKTSEFAFLLERYVDGPTLKDVLRQRKALPIEEALVYLKALSAALGYAHAHGVVHCDVKPGNVMIDRGGSIYLTDFGVARHAESTTTTLGVAGTPAYMAPEQCRSEAVTAETDVYALGVVLYEMVTGTRPFQAGATSEKQGSTSGEQIRYAHLHTAPPDPCQANPAIPRTLGDVILKALTKDPQARYSKTWAMLEAACAAVGANPDAVPDRAAVSQEPGSTLNGTALPKRAPPQYSPRKVKWLGPLWGRWSQRGIVLLVAAVVAIIILNVPPVQLPARITWLGCTEVSSKSPSADGPDGLNVSLVDPAGASLRLKMSRVTQDKLPAAAIKVMPAKWTSVGSMYQMGACGNNKIPVILSVPAEVDAASANTIDLVSWDGKSWQWVGGQADLPNSMVVAQLDSLPPNVMAVQTAPTSPVVGAELPIGGAVGDKAALLVNEYAVTAFVVTNDGGLQGDPAELPEPVEGAQAMWIVTRNWATEGAVNAGMVEDILADSKLRTAHAKAVTEAVTRAKYKGVMIDYRGLSDDSRAAFTRLVTELATSLHKSNKLLGVVVPAAVPLGDEWDTGGYDWRAIGAVADVVQVYVPDDPTVAPRRIETMLRWGVSQVNRAKLQLAITASSVKQTGVTVQAISYEDALKPFKAIAAPGVSGAVSPGAQVKLTLGSQPSVDFDEALRMYRYTLTASDNTTSTIWLNTGASLAQKLSLALAFNLRGVMLQGLLTSAQEPGIWSAMEQYQAQAPVTAPARLQVVWTVRSADGTQLPGGTSTLTDTAYLWTAPTNPGQYTIAAALPGSATRSELAINVAQLTPRPTAVLGATGKCPDATFVADVTVPDNTQFDKNKEFTKVWRVRNSGVCDWPAGTVAAYVSGDRMSAPDTVQVGIVKIGETVDIRVKMKSPDEDGNFQAVWKLMDDKANSFCCAEAMTVAIVTGQPQQPQAAVASPTLACPPVIGPFASIWQSAKDRLGCATSNAHETWMAEEVFQRGRMFWRQDKDDEYVMAVYGNGTWGIYLGDWKEGDPSFTCGSESSPPTPQRGFGRAWCKYSDIRTGLGNATTAEWGYDGVVQDFAYGVILRTDSGTTFVLYSGDHKWETR